VTGSVIGKNPERNAKREKQINVKRKTLEVVFAQTAGVQSPTEYEENKVKVKDVLMTQGEGSEKFGPEQSGEETTDIVESSEEVEVRA
jgi:hypothetical protein